MEEGRLHAQLRDPPLRVLVDDRILPDDVVGGVGADVHDPDRGAPEIPGGLLQAHTLRVPREDHVRLRAQNRDSGLVDHSPENRILGWKRVRERRVERDHAGAGSGQVLHELRVPVPGPGIAAERLLGLDVDRNQNDVRGARKGSAEAEPAVVEPALERAPDPGLRDYQREERRGERHP